MSRYPIVMSSHSFFRYSPNPALLAARAVDLIWATYPGYSEELFTKDELFQSVEEHMSLAIRVIRRGKTATAHELQARRGLGERRAQQGVPLESVIQAYRSTERVIFLDLLAAIQDWPIKLTTHYADLIITTFDLLTQEIINSYREASAEIESVRERAESELIQALASGVSPLNSDIDRWVDILGIDPAARYAAIAIFGRGSAASRESHHLRRRLHQALQPYISGSPLYGDVSEGTLALVSPYADVSQLATIVRDALLAAGQETGQVAGIGEISVGLAAAGNSCAHALIAARAAAAREPLTVLSYSDALLEAFLMSRPTIADRVFDDFLEPLRLQPHLVETLESLFRNGLSQASVARELFVHVNTVTHRVRRIRELSGKDPLNVEDGAQFLLALRWSSLRAH